MTRILGLDLGQSHDPAAAVVADRVAIEPRGFIGPRNPNFKARLYVRAIRQWPLGTDYNDIVTDVLSLESDALVVDFGGVGRPVVDMLRKQAMLRNYRGKIKPVQLIGSSGRATVKHEQRGSHVNVPKVDVVTSVILAEQKGILRLPPVPEMQQLLKQLTDFRMKITKSANFQYGNVAGSHDDLVIALGLCCWFAAKFGNLKPAVWCG